MTTASFTLNANRGISLGAPGGTMDPISGTKLTYNGIVAGTGFLGPKNNPGTLVLGGVNTYSGATIIHAGILSISADANLGTAPGSATPGSLVLSGGTLVTTASFTLNANRGITLGSTGGTINPAVGTKLTYNGIVAGTAGLGPMNLGGTLVLGGVNTYSGTTIVSAGTLQDGIANALPATTTLTVNGTGTFDLGGFAQTVAGLADGGVSTGTVTDSGAAATFTVNNGATNTFSGLLTNGANALSLTKTGAGSLTLAHVNTYSGTTTISAGTLQDGIANALPATTTLKVNGTGTFDLGGFAQTVAGLADGGVSTGTVTDSGTTATFTVNAAGAYSFSGLLSGTLTLTKTGLGALTLSHANTYGGITTIGSGTLSISADNNLGAAPSSATPSGADHQRRQPDDHGQLHAQSQPRDLPRRFRRHD